MSIEKIRPIYNELKGYIRHAPDSKIFYSEDQSLWDSLNGAIDSLNSLTQETKYDRFKITPTNNPGGETFQPYTNISIQEYKTKLAGLISYLYGEYFSDESEPFSGFPSTYVTQTQTQNQQQTIQLVLQLQEQVIDALSDPNLKENEKNFLNKLKDSLSTASSFTSLLKTILDLASRYSIDVESLSKFLF